MIVRGSATTQRAHASRAFANREDVSSARSAVLVMPMALAKVAWFAARTRPASRISAIRGTPAWKMARARMASPVIAWRLRLFVWTVRQDNEGVSVMIWVCVMLGLSVWIIIVLVMRLFLGVRFWRICSVIFFVWMIC